MSGPRRSRVRPVPRAPLMRTVRTDTSEAPQPQPAAGEQRQGDQERERCDAQPPAAPDERAAAPHEAAGGPHAPPEALQRPVERVGSALGGGPARAASARPPVAGSGRSQGGQRACDPSASVFDLRARTPTSAREPLRTPTAREAARRRASAPRAPARRRSARARGAGPRPSRPARRPCSPPVFSMKLACLGEKRAPPTARPLQPASASSSPALRPFARGSSGFLKVEPNVLMPCGWASWRRARISASDAVTVATSERSSAKQARVRICPGAMFERR